MRRGRAVISLQPRPSPYDGLVAHMLDQNVSVLGSGVVPSPLLQPGLWHDVG